MKLLKEGKSFPLIFETILARILLAILSFSIGVILARYLSVEGRGYYAFLAVVCGLGVQLVNFGLSSANTYFIASKKMSLSQVQGVTIGVSVALLVLALLIWIFFPYISFFRENEISRVHSLILLLSIPANIYFLLNMAILQGVGEVRRYNFSEIFNKLLFIVGLGLLIFTDSVSSGRAYFLANFFILLNAILIGFFLARIEFPSLRGLSRKILSNKLVYSFKGYLVLLFGYLLLKQDIIFVKKYLSADDLGVYSIASNLNDFMLMVPAVFGFLLFPQFSSPIESRRKKKILKENFLLLFFIMGVIGLVAYYLCPYLIPILFGEEYRPAIKIFRILIIGILFYGPNTVISVFFAAQGNPGQYVAVWLAGMLTNFFLNYYFLVVLKLQLTGVAWASVCSYLLVLVLHLFLIAITTAREENDGINVL